MSTIFDELDAVFQGKFMQPYIEEADYFVVPTNLGDEIVPADVVGRTCSTAAEAFANYVEGTISDPDELIDLRHGYIARLSAPGYLDATDWCAFETAEEAAEFLIEMYGDE